MELAVLIVCLVLRGVVLAFTTVVLVHDVNSWFDPSGMSGISGASGKDDLPLNPYTRPMFERSPVRNLLRHWWQSSPEEWVEKGGRKIRKQFGGG